MTRIVYCCNHGRCERAPAMFVHDGDCGGEFRCDRHAPIEWQLVALRIAVMAQLERLMMPLIRMLTRLLPEWADLPGRGWKRCPHGILGWSYQKPRRIFRYCRVCGQGQQRLPADL